MAGIGMTSPKREDRREIVLEYRLLLIAGGAGRYLGDTVPLVLGKELTSEDMIRRGRDAGPRTVRTGLSLKLLAHRSVNTGVYQRLKKAGQAENLPPSDPGT
jgi:hypothetical protein